MLSKNFIKWSARFYAIFFLCLWTDETILSINKSELSVSLFNILLTIGSYGLIYFIPIIILSWVGWNVFENKEGVKLKNE